MGCGQDDAGSSTGSVSERPDPSTIARIAVGGPVESLDPITATSRTERLISRQIHEPLVSRLRPPFGVAGVRRGPARTLGSAQGSREWRFELRSGVSFHDEESLNGEAVIANWERWQQTGIADRLLPEVEAVFSPRPGEVRFRLGEPVADFPDRLGDPRLGLVSPGLLGGGEGTELGPSGTGPYEFSEQTASRVLLEVYPRWWGEGAGLGPGILQLNFLLLDDSQQRVDALLEGDVVIADGLDPGARLELERVPLLTTVADRRGLTGISAMVRGLDSPAPDQPLAQVWLTELR